MIIQGSLNANVTVKVTVKVTVTETVTVTVIVTIYNYCNILSLIIDSGGCTQNFLKISPS
jgi:hypothetical protein